MTMSLASIHGLPVTPEESSEYRRDSVLGPMDRDSYAIHKHRKSASTGGGRAWTEEEESYLLRTRSNKMPYKHIAAHLNKTELACRLHYHQMSYGSNRRKRTGSISSTCSVSSFNSSFNPLSALRESSPEHAAYTTLSPVNSPPSSPESISHGIAPISTSPAMSQRPILPKPIMSTARPMLPSSSELSKALHLDTTFAKQKEYAQRGTPIDHAKLRSLYIANRESFWTHIASQYSSNFQISGAELEEAFLSSRIAPTRLRGSSPPTPEPSPQVTGGTFTSHAHEHHGFSAVNPSPRTESSISTQSPTERCALSGLLN